MRQINIYAVVQKITAVFNSISGIVLAFLVVISVLNIVGRFMKYPITGTYEIVQYGFAVIICLAVAYTALEEGHISIDLIFKLYPQKVKIFLEVINKILGICIFALISWRLWADGIDAYIIGETSSTLRIPVFLFQFALATGFALMGLVIILKLLREQG
ncbi:MAG TPA: TRAP transporter small permease [Firmicutes bacterium]|jgi:TRAP-type C4-dicarboxylate transport system permease small subunit|nr:TRAP transporter small permease [Bacillota bacterium]